MSVSGEQEFTKPLAFVGEKTFGSTQGYQDYANQYVYEINIPNCSMPGKVFVGQRKDPFVVNLGETFDLVNYVPIEAGAFPGGIEQSSANDDLRNKNVNTIALELQKVASQVTAMGSSAVGQPHKYLRRDYKILTLHLKSPTLMPALWFRYHA